MLKFWQDVIDYLSLTEFGNIQLCDWYADGHMEVLGHVLRNFPELVG